MREPAAAPAAPAGSATGVGARARRLGAPWALGVAAATSAVTLVGAFLDAVSIEPTDFARFRAWVAAPRSTAGVDGLLLCAAAVAGRLVARRRARAGHRRSKWAEPATWAVVAAVAVVLGLGVAASHRRSHPGAAIRRALDALVLPADVEPLPIGPEPGPLPYDVPRAVKEWQTAAGDPAATCARLRPLLVAWLRDGVDIRVAPLSPGVEVGCWVTGRRGSTQAQVTIDRVGGAGDRGGTSRSAAEVAGQTRVTATVQPAY